MHAFGDARIAARLLWRSPGYGASVIAVLALTVGANTAIFSAVHGVLLKPLPITEPDDLVIVWDADARRNLPVVELSYRTFEHWSAHSRSFASAAVIGSSAWHAVLQGRGAPVRLASTGVSASFFPTLGASPLLGRTLRPEDDLPNAPAVAVLSHAAWVQYFGADPAVIGSLVQVDKSRTVVGVMPPEFDFPRGTSFWFPVVPLLSGISRPDFDALASVGVLFVVGRLQPGVTPPMAAAELDRLSRGSEGAPAPRRFGSAVVVTPFLDYLLGPVRQGLWALWAAVSILLLIACANVSGLILTRASMRSRDHAVRVALGARRRDIGRLWFTEAAILSLAGGIVGLAASWWMTKAIVALAPGDIPRLTNVTLDPAAVLFAIAVVLIVAVLCGAAAARHAARRNLIEGLNEAAYGTPGRRRLRARSAAVVLQIALSVVLLIAAGLVLRSFAILRQLDVGFTPGGVLTMFVASSASRESLHEMLTRIEALPRIEAAGAVYLRPLELGPIGQETAVRLEGQTEAPAQENPTLNFQVATPGYFHAMRIRLVRGRFFSDRDRADTEPVALVGETAARRLWPDGDAVGKRLLPRGQKQWRTVVGVVGDVHYRGLGDARLDIYEPALQSAHTASYLVIRTADDPIAAIAAVRAEVRRFHPAAVIDSVTTLDAIVSRAMAPWRFTSWLLTVLASVAFLLTTIGLFSLVSLEVSGRRHELAIRVALGAQRASLFGSVLRPAAWHSAIGLAAGAVAAAALTRTLRGFLFGVGPLDPLTWIVVLTTTTGVVGIAAYLAARPAAAADPLTLIRR